MIALIWLLSCASPEPRAPAWQVGRPTQAGRYVVSLAFAPDPPPLGGLFTVSAILRDPAGRPVEDAVVAIDARMPSHGHGMATRPVPRPGECGGAECRHPGGVYTSDGFKLHMAGPWALTVTVSEGPRGPDTTSFVYDMPASPR